MYTREGINYDYESDRKTFWVTLPQALRRKFQSSKFEGVLKDNEKANWVEKLTDGDVKCFEGQSMPRAEDIIAHIIFAKYRIYGAAGPGNPSEKDTAWLKIVLDGKNTDKYKEYEIREDIYKVFFDDDQYKTYNEDMEEAWNDFYTNNWEGDKVYADDYEGWPAFLKLLGENNDSRGQDRVTKAREMPWEKVAEFFNDDCTPK